MWRADNMEKTKSVLLMLVIVGLLVHSSQALTCYECQSDKTNVNSNCEDPFKSDGITTCTGFACMKGKTIIAGTTLTRRGCSSSFTGSADSCSNAKIGHENTEVCYCDSDKCNGAVMTSPVGHVMGVVALLINIVIGYLL